MGALQKLTFLAEAKALSRGGLYLNGHMNKNLIFFSSRIKVYVFETRRYETDSFVIKKILVVKEKYFVEI